MMIRTGLTLLAAFFIISAVGCASSSPLGNGSIYTGTKHDQTWSEDTSPFAYMGSLFGSLRPNAHSGPVGAGIAQKQGEDCVSNYFPLNIFYLNLSPSTAMAMQNGGITKIASADRSTTSVLFFYSKECIIVTGQ